MKVVRNTYRVLRSIALAAVLMVASVYVLLYILLAMPPVQSYIRGVAESELSDYLKGRVRIGRLDIVPFSELRLYDIEVAPNEGEEPVLSVVRLGAGIDLGRLLFTGAIDISYVEISGVKAYITQKSKDGPLNIDFILKAFAPKDKNKPPAKFNLDIRKIAIRNGSVRFYRLWCKEGAADKIDFNRLKVDSLYADLKLPKLSNDLVAADVSRLSFRLAPSLTVSNLKAAVTYTPQKLRIDGFRLELPQSEIKIPNLELVYGSPAEIADELKEGNLHLSIPDAVITPSDFRSLLPVLAGSDEKVMLSLAAEGNLQEIYKLSVDIRVPEVSSAVKVEGKVAELLHPKYLTANINKLDATVDASLLKVAERIGLKIPEKVSSICRNIGRIELTGSGSADVERSRFSGKGEVATGQGSLRFQVDKSDKIAGTISSNGFDVGGAIGLQAIGKAAFVASATVMPGAGWPAGEAELSVENLILFNKPLAGIELSCVSTGESAEISLNSSDHRASFYASADLRKTAENIEGSVEIDIQTLDCDYLSLPARFNGYDVSGKLTAELTGQHQYESMLKIAGSDLRFGNAHGSEAALSRLDGLLYHDGARERTLRLSSDWMDLEASISGNDESNVEVFDFNGVKTAAVELLAQTFPVLGLQSKGNTDSAEKVNVEINLKADDSVYRFWNLPVYPLGNARLSAFLDAETGEAEIAADMPYLQQGKGTLIERTSLSGVLNRETGTFAFGGFTHYPTKKGTLDMDVKILGREGNIYSDIRFLPGAGNLITGNLGFNTILSRNPLSDELQARIDIVPSTLGIAGSEWQLGNCLLEWKDGKGYVDNLSLNSDHQYINVAGVASAETEDRIVARLGGIDLDYVFGILNINYVTFGGIATGEIAASAVMSKEPDIATKFLNVKRFSYNGSPLGDAVLFSRFDVDEKKVEIDADIADGGRHVARIDGGIWVTRDSLSFELDAHKINAGFMSPFVEAFATDVKGRASGKLKLYGTFSDIDLTGRAKADSLSLRLLSTNVAYTGSDSIIMNSGSIEIPGFRVYDRNGNSAVLSGYLKHRYFHEPEFDFRLADAKGLLCYYTSAKDNPVWYGTVYGSGSGHLSGRPGWVGVDVDMTSNRNSSFTFVLSDKEQAADYSFLTFTDRRKESGIQLQPDTVPEFLRRFKKNQTQEQQGEESTVELDIRASVNPGVLVTLVMDPEAGDKITARGSGALQMSYNSKSEDMKMYGKYELEEGDYNFSLQDIILKQFTIKPGSSISFNGDPLAANLDIAATYRVNANLTDLDQSFATDHDLNRTNVPVDALLLVRGDLNQPDINFDIELPTLTADVERKVKSLMSTDDLLSRQIIYLLALNRFYTPENGNMTGNANSGSTELSSVASSTISSHLSNMLSSMTDNLVLSPSFRSDKGDFSDVEVDLGLSSRLLDNRLLINGNLGYRDRNVTGQSTQFVGDFDIEYLLNRSGNLRLKAYNRFNDQNYYLRQALTTQGVGIVVRRDFDNIFSFLRPLRKTSRRNERQSEPQNDNEQDSIK